MENKEGFDNVMNKEHFFLGRHLKIELAKGTPKKPTHHAPPANLKSDMFAKKQSDSEMLMINHRIKKKIIDGKKLTNHEIEFKKKFKNWSVVKNRQRQKNNRQKNVEKTNRKESFQKKGKTVNINLNF